MQMKTSTDERIALRLIQRVNLGETVYLRTISAVYDVCQVIDQSTRVLTVRYVGKKFDRRKRRWYSCVSEDVIDVWNIVQLRRLIDGRAIHY